MKSKWHSLPGSGQPKVWAAGIGAIALLAMGAVTVAISDGSGGSLASEDPTAVTATTSEGEAVPPGPQEYP